MDNENDYQNIINNGLYELASKYKKAGAARYIGISGHKPNVAIKDSQSGLFGRYHASCKFSTPKISTPFRRGFTQGDHWDELLLSCKQNDIGLIAIKPFWGGKSFYNKRIYSNQNLNIVCIIVFLKSGLTSY